MNQTRPGDLLALRFFCLLVAIVVTGCSGPENIRIVRKGQEIKGSPSGAFTGNVIKLLESCSVHSTSYAVKTNTWDELLRSDSFVYIKFAEPQSLNVMMQTGASRFRQPIPIDEILVPFPEGRLPGHIYARTGTNVFAFTKYDPVALKRVAFEKTLQLSSVKPYSDLAGLDRWTWRRLKNTVRELLHLH